MKDSIGREVLTVTEFVAGTYNGNEYEFEAEDGFHTVARRPDGYYTVDGKSKELLEGIRTWFGTYHYEFGEAVFYPRTRKTQSAG